MSRVKQRENVLCAVRVFRSPSIHQKESRSKDRISFYDAGWNLSPRVVFETTNTQRTLISRERCNGRAAAMLLEDPMIPVIMTPEEIKIWR